jgi:hypothetical protein
VGKFDDVPTLPLFDVEHVEQGSSRTENSRRPARSVAWGRCSRHANPKEIGLVRQGEHLYWREHDYPTWGKARMTCDASGVRLCESSARTVPGQPTPTCDCEA